MSTGYVSCRQSACLLWILIDELSCLCFPTPSPPASKQAPLGGLTQRTFACCRDNILFGQAWQKERYEAVLKACALEVDIQQMTEGDATLIGDRGVTLSGGQRARLSLARAIYQVPCLSLQMPAALSSGKAHT